MLHFNGCETDEMGLNIYVNNCLGQFLEQNMQASLNERLGCTSFIGAVTNDEVKSSISDY